jgi:HEAT repeat protein
MKKIILMMLLIPGLFLMGEDAESEKKDTDTHITEWREVLLYGIDEEVLKVVQQVRSSGATSLNEELISVLAESVSPAVRREILMFFQDREDISAEGIAIRLLLKYDDEERELIIALISYLSGIKSADSLEILRELVDHEDPTVAAEAIRALGKTGREALLSGNSTGAFLLEKLDDNEFDEKLKPEIILALGELKGEDAVERLIEIVEDPDQDKGWRMYAADSLGKIGDPRAVDVLKDLFKEKDALLKTYAASALANFQMGEVIDILMQGLKDSNWRVRATAAKALANKESDKALDILMYKARKDPVNTVRIEAMKALGEIDRKKGFDLLRELYADEGQSFDIRGACLDVLVEKDLGPSIDAFREVIEKHIDDPIFKEKLLGHTGKRLSAVDSPLVRGLLERLLDAKNPVARIHGIRGIALNRFEGLKNRLEKMSEEDPHPGVKNEAGITLERW